MTSRASGVVNRHSREGGFEGAALVVRKNGRTVLEHYAGEAAPGLAAGPGVLWPLASISKVYTATVMMRLVEEGVITLSAPVCQLFPKFSGEGREEVRLRHLLTHTSGMIYESPDMEARLKSHTPLPELIDEACHMPLQFRPGTRFKYADYNYLIAGHVAELVTGKALPELLRNLVLDPAGLDDTFMPPLRQDEHRLARVRGVMGEGTDGAMYNSWYARELAHPAFGVFSSAVDLARFGSLFTPGGGRLLSEASVRAMTTDQTGGVPGIHPSMQGYAADAFIPWGIGFARQNAQVPCLWSDLASHNTFGHGGATGCELVIDPVFGLVVALVSNTHLGTGREPWYSRLQSILNSVFAEFAGEPVPELTEA